MKTRVKVPRASRILGYCLTILLFVFITACDDNGDCDSIPFERPQLTFCQSDSKLTFEVHSGSQLYTYSRTEFLTQWRHLISTWLRNNSLENLIDPTTQIELWGWVRFDRPSLAAFALQVKPQGGSIGKNFLVRVDSWSPTHWKILDQDVAILGGKVYPDDFGYLATRTVLISYDDVIDSQLRPFVESHGALNLVKRSGNNWLAYSKPFQELDLIQSIMNDPAHKHLVETITPDLYLESEASRGLFFTFPLVE